MFKVFKKIPGLIIVLALSPLCFAGTSYINEIPDFTQTDIRGNKSGNGQQYCGPVAVSNSIIWLNKNKGDQIQLIHKLASKDYMNTSLKNGTGTSGIIRGVEKITGELFDGYKILEYEGWRKHPEKNSSGVKIPSINRIKSAVTRNSTAWINVGWYLYNKKNNEYNRIGGHWVTLVGSKYKQLILHDPAPRAGKTFSNEYVEYSILKSGTLVGKKWGLPFSAQGFVSLGKGMHKKKGADFAIVDGVVYLEI